MSKLLITIVSIVILSTLAIKLQNTDKQIENYNRLAIENEQKAEQAHQKAVAKKKAEEKKAKAIAKKKAEEKRKSELALQRQKEAEARKVRVASQNVATAAPVQSQTTYAVGCENYRGLVSQYSWNVDVAMRVMSSESGCNPQAANTTDNHGVCMGSFGLFQISCHSGQVYNPAQNVAIAWSKYSNSGWQPWGVCTNGSVHCY